MSEKELENLRSRRWNFSSSTTKVSDLASSRGNSDREEEQSNGSQNNLLAIKMAKLSVSGAVAASGAKNANSSNKETVGEAFSRLRRSITPESLKNFNKDNKPTNMKVNLNLHAIPESSLDLDSPLPFDSPLPLDSPLPFDSLDAVETPSSPTPGNGSIMMKIPVIVERSNSSDAASQNENRSEAASCASSGGEESGGEEADVEDANDSEVPLSSTRDDEEKKSGSRNKGHPSPLSLVVTADASNSGGSSGSYGGNSRNGGSRNSGTSGGEGGGGGGLLRVYDSGDDSSYHSASVEKERTRLREEGKEEVRREEKDALRILGMVRTRIHTHRP